MELKIFIIFLQDVAIKVFSKQEYSDDIILSFRQEVVIIVTFYMSCKSVLLCTQICMYPRFYFPSSPCLEVPSSSWSPFMIASPI